MQNPTPQLVWRCSTETGIIYRGPTPAWRFGEIRSDWPAAGLCGGVDKRGVRAGRRPSPASSVAPLPATGRKCEQDNISDHCAKMREIPVGAEAIADRSDRMHARQFAGGL